MKIKVLNKDGSITLVAFEDIKKHQESIIEDNILFGFKCGSAKEANIYVKEARAEYKNLRKMIFNNPNIVLKIDDCTQQYVVA